MLIVDPSGPLRGTVALPGDKSISHRAVIFAALSGRMVVIRNLSQGEDLLRTVEIFRALGVKIQKGKSWVVHGKPPERLKRPAGILYCGNSGTTMRLMMGVLAALPFESRLTGDRSLDRRPMDRVILPLRRMGGHIEEIHKGGRRFIHIRGAGLKGIDYRLPIASAQVKSALYLAGMVAGVPVKVRESVKTRDHTERMIRLFKKRIRVVTIPGDPSSAAFLVVAGLINQNPKTRIFLKNACLNPTRTGFLEILRRMGAKIEVIGRGELSGEEVGDLLVRSSSLKAVQISARIVPRLIDEVPILAVAAACAEGGSCFSGLGELRFKETDRIRALARELPKFGVPIREKPDGLTIEGGRFIRGARATSYGDHRIAMSLAILGTVARGKSVIRDVDCIKTSFPRFVPCLKMLGAKINEGR